MGGDCDVARVVGVGVVVVLGVVVVVVVAWVMVIVFVSFYAYWRRVVARVFSSRQWMILFCYMMSRLDDPERSPPMSPGDGWVGPRNCLRSNS